MTDKKSIVVYEGWASMILNLPDEMAGELIKGLLGYAFKDTEPESNNPAIGAMLAMMKDKLDEDAAKYKAKVDRLRENASRNDTDTKSSRNRAEIETKSDGKGNDIGGVSVSVSVSDSVSVNESPSETKREKQAKEKRTRFSAPSVDEVRDYCRERGNSIDAETFVDFYASKGWKVGNSPMKDWQSAIRTWEKRECRASPPASFNANDYLQGIIQGGA